jgi:hypothetical protein
MAPVPHALQQRLPLSWHVFAIRQSPCVLEFSDAAAGSMQGISCNLPRTRDQLAGKIVLIAGRVAYYGCLRNISANSGVPLL